MKKSIKIMIHLSLAAVVMVLIPQAMAATVVIHDDPTPGVHVRLVKDDCAEAINAMDGVKAGDWTHGGYQNVWLWGGSPSETGSVTVTPTSAFRAICIQYGSDSNDGITDIYVDDMVNPLARIDTYNRGSWYVEIKGLANTTHTVKVQSSNNTNITGVIPSPHRATPALGDNDVYFFCVCSPPIPTLTEWGMIIMFVVMAAGIVWFVMRQRRSTATA